MQRAARTRTAAALSHTAPPDLIVFKTLENPFPKSSVWESHTLTPIRYNLRIVTDIAIVGPRTLATAGA